MTANTTATAGVMGATPGECRAVEKTLRRGHLAAAAAAGYARVGLVAAWLGAYPPLLGFNAHHAFVGLPSRTRAEQLAYFLELDGLAFYAVVALVFGTAAFAAGYVLRTGVAVLRGGGTAGDLGL